MEKILGIDLGTNSIGWAIRDTAELDNQIVDKGVLTFDKGVGEEKGIEVPKVKVRTEARGKRHNYQAEKYRKYNLLETLIKNEMCPLTIEELNKWRHYKKGVGRKYPQRKEFIDWLRFDFDGNGKPDFERFGLSKHESYYVFRAMIIDETKKDIFIAEPHIIGRVLYQIVQRRGYNNMFNLLDSDKDESETIMKGGGEAGAEGVNSIKEFLVKHKTLGAALYNLQKETNARIRKRYNLRSDFDAELKEICRVQDLEHLYTLFRSAIIEQRPLKTQKGLIGFCTLNRPLKSASGKYYKAGKKRIPLSHPLYEEFRTWVDINNLKIEAPDGKDQLEFIEKEVFPFFNRTSDFNYSDKTSEKKKKYKAESNINEDEISSDKKETITRGLKYKIEKIGGVIHSKFDEDLDEDNDGKKYKGNILLSKFEKIFGENWKDILKWNETLIGKEKSGKYLRAEDIWHLIFDSTITKQQTKDLGDRLIPILQKHFPSIKFDKGDFDNIRLQNGYATLSETTIKTIIPQLKRGLIYSHAVFVGNLENVFSKKLDDFTLDQLKDEYQNILHEHKTNKEIYGIVNGLISDRMNERDRINMGENYILDELDINDIEQKIKDNFKTKVWNKKSKEKQIKFIDEVRKLYQTYLRQPLGIERGRQFYKVYRIEEMIIELLKTKYNVSDERIKKYLWHPSEQEVYSPAYIKADKDGVIFTNDKGKEILFLGDPNPISRGFKNPMAIKTLQYLKKLLNYLLQQKKIDSDTKIVVEIARELNDANTRNAIGRYQNDRKKLREKNIKEIKEFFDNAGDTNKNINEDLIARYELWLEQNKKCIYCTENISCNDVMNNVAQIEHTIPEGISQCTEMFNLTLAHPQCNNTKAKRIPTQWTENYELIKSNVGFMYAKYMDYKGKHEATYAAAKKATTKESKDRSIQDRHYYKQYLSYWRKKYETFVLEEVTSQFRRQQLTDTQIITKYALPYLKTVFKKIEIQKGIITADFRKIYKIQPQVEKKDRTKHSHHAIDAAVLTLIPAPSIRDFIRKEYHKAKENNLDYYCKPKNWNDFDSEYIHKIENEVLINFQAQHRTLTPTSKKVRKRGEIKIFKDEEGNKTIRKAHGDTIRGQLHKESIYGAILKPLFDENNKAINQNGQFLHEEKVSYVKRVHLEVNTLFGFKYDKKKKDIEKFKKEFENIIDPNVKKLILTHIELQLQKGIDPESVFSEPVYMLDKKGNKVHPIRRVRVFQGNINPPKIKKIEGEKNIYLSNFPHKQFTYADNTEYISMLCYTGFDQNKKEIFCFNPLTTLGKSKDRMLPQSISENDIIYDFSWELKPDLKVILKKRKDENLKSLTEKELLKRIYKVNNFYPAYVGKYKFFYATIHYHLVVVSSEISNPKISKEINFENPILNPLVRINLAKSNFVIENIDFEIKLDGKIEWKKND